MNDINGYGIHSASVPIHIVMPLMGANIPFTQASITFVISNTWQRDVIVLRKLLFLLPIVKESTSQPIA